MQSFANPDKRAWLCNKKREHFMSWYRLFLPFAGAYFLSYLFRTINAVVGPILGAELELGAAQLGLLTSAYFVTFGVAQLPLGMLLDRFGARRVNVGLLLFAATGAVVFASSQSITGLTVGRGLIGLGVSACLMSAFKAFSQWFPPERLPSLTGWIMTFGTLGALVSTAPLEAALQVASWRQIFFVLGGLTILIAAWQFFGVPEKPSTARPESFSAQWAGIRQVLCSRHFWRIAPTGLFLIGGFMAIQSLWSSAWLMQVNGYSRAQAADHLAAMSMAMIVGYALIGMAAGSLARRGISPLMLLVGGLSTASVILLLIISEVCSQHYLLWIAYGSFSTFGTLSYAVLSAGFPASLSGRVNTTYNLTSFVGAFVFQWGIGLLIDWQLVAGCSNSIAHRNAFSVVLVCQVLAIVWLLIPGERKKPARMD